jgi:hypothetical protein
MLNLSNAISGCILASTTYETDKVNYNSSNNFLMGCQQSGSTKNEQSNRRKGAIDTNMVHDVSLINLIATPELFDGKKVRVIGFLHLEFEGNCLYLHEEDYNNSIQKNALRLNLGYDQYKQWKILSNHYVALEGAFDQDEQGSMGFYSGSVVNVTRLEGWSKIDAPRPRKNNISFPGPR